jgi:hypothetical protein
MLPHIAGLAGLGVLDCQGHDSLLLDNDFLNNEVIEALPSVAILLQRCAVFRLNFDVWSGIQFSADAPIEAGSFERVRSKTFLLLCVALCASVFLADPLLFLFVPDGYDAVCVVSGVASHPTELTDSLIQNVLVATGILVQQ